MKLLVTGGAGFIGSNFIHYWLDKYPKDSIVNLDKLTYAGNPANLVDIKTNRADRYKFIRGDIANKSNVEEAFGNGIDVVVNFAAESHVDRSIYDPLVFVKTNVLGTAVLLEVARKHKVKKFLHVSTDEVYGELPLEGREKFSENTMYNPSSAYAASKAGSDHLVRAYFKTYGMYTLITNCSNNVGPFQHPEKFFPLTITNVLENKPIRVYGKGKNRRDWIWVYDHCRGIDAALKKGKPGETYLFGGRDGAKYTNLEIAQMIVQKMGRGEIEFVTDRPGHDLRYEIDWSKAQSELGWEPKYNIRQILDKTIEWYQNHRQWWKPLKRRKIVFIHDREE